MNNIKYWSENGNIECNAEIENCDNLDDLFKLWKEAQKNIKIIDKNENCLKNTGNFTRDGYIDEKEYKKSKKKVLFILKESNILKGRNVESNEIKEDEQADFYSYFLKEKIVINGETKEIYKYDSNTNMIIPIAYADYKNKYKFFDNIPKQKEKMARMAKYILDKEITSSYKELCNALKQVAFMNINKMGGTNKTNSKELYLYYKKYKNFILKEIEILEPQVIVIMVGNSKIVNDLNFELNEKLEKNIKIIPMLHTATRGRSLNIKNDEENFFNKNIAPSIEMNWNTLNNENYKEYQENIFNKNKNGPFIKFNKTTLEYLIKFIKRYEENNLKLKK